GLATSIQSRNPFLATALIPFTFQLNNFMIQLREYSNKFYLPVLKDFLLQREEKSKVYGLL
ncbi:MAG: hypothetical protein ACQES9_13200, partial [Myxococcota bacterium]